MNKFKKALVGLTALASLGTLTACSDADTVSENLSTEADNFRVWRQVVLYNSIADKYIVEIQGYCSLGNHDDDDEVTVTCKVADGNGTDSYTKDIYKMSDNTMVFAHQLKGVHVSPDHYKVVLKPETIIPAFEVK